MLSTLTITDDFLSVDRFNAIRAEVLERGFTTEVIKEGKDLPTAIYENVQVRWMPNDFERGLFQLMGRGIKMQQQAFRLGFYNSKLHNLVHADHCCAQLAAVYYVNLPEDCQGGTAFWKHATHGWNMMPTQEQLDAVGYTLTELAEDWHNRHAWELVSLAGMRTNRLIVYPTNAFHSRFPFQGFGSKEDIEHARIIGAFFFNLVN